MSFSSLKVCALAATLTASSLLLPSCSSDKKKEKGGKPEVYVHELSDADMLNPITYVDANAGYINQNLFQPLLAIDFKSLELVPVLAKERPLIEKTDDGGMRITYNIRPEATWDNGSPITAKDIEFTLKVIKNPKVNNPQNKPYYEFIKDIQFYPEDPKKFTLICGNVYILAEASSGDYGVIPMHMYDPKGLMKDFTIKQLNEEKAKLENDAKINEFAADFNSEKRQREPQNIEGSGAYKFKEWVTGQRIVIEKKKNWWGEKMNKENVYFEANAPSIIYQTINDQTTALVALKAGNIDVMHGIKSKDFVDLPKSNKITENFNLHTPMMLAYAYIGMNTRKPKFSDVETRMALAHLVDVDKIIKKVFYGLAQRVVGPIHPSKKSEYNSEIKPREYNVEKAKELLAKAGWKDSNGDGVIDRKVNGEHIEFTIDFTYNSGNDERKAVALLFQEEARKVGINVNVVAQEWSVYLDNQKHHRFEMFYGSWISTPVPNDHKQIYHTESYNGGSNYVGFGNNESDALIDSIRIELDDTKRSAMNKRFQQMLHDNVPVIFLHSPKEKIAIHNRFSNAEPSVMRPGYWEAAFRVGSAESKN